MSLLARVHTKEHDQFREKFLQRPRYRWMRIASLFVRGADCQKQLGCMTMNQTGTVKGMSIDTYRSTRPSGFVRYICVYLDPFGWNANFPGESVLQCAVSLHFPGFASSMKMVQWSLAQSTGKGVESFQQSGSGQNILLKWMIWGVPRF